MSKILDAYMRNRPMYETVGQAVGSLLSSAVLFYVYRYCSWSGDMYYIYKDRIYRKRFVRSAIHITLVVL